MALHNTQCPHCFTTYVISDEQYRVSEGMVRCGTCRERFQARFIDGEVETPRFDPREAFIEPLSEDNHSDDLEPDDAQHIVFIDPDDGTTTNIQLTSFEDNISSSINSDLSLDIDDDAPVTPIDSSKLSTEEMLANIRAKQAREKDQKDQALQQEFNLANPDSTLSTEPESSELDVSSATDISEPLSNDDHLIDEVDSLVNDKLLHDPFDQNPFNKDNGKSPTTPRLNDSPGDKVPSSIETHIAPAADRLSTKASAANSMPRPELNTDFKIASNRRKGSLWAWFFALPLIAIIAALCVLLLYQLWMKQIITLDKDPSLRQNVTKVINRAATELEKIDIDLPVRRNLSQLELLSARTEAHPTRSSTTLLRVDILNRANISQPLPWLEMTLTDADGGLVALRNLSPNDYIYNNSTNNLIAAKELKKITIELLSFPKQATGYEIKLLNR